MSANAAQAPHGAQHALGWFGGYGFAGTLGWMTDTLGFLAPGAALAIAVELLAPIALVLGIGSRLAAVGIVGLMLGAISTHLPDGFFMNWFGTLPAGSEGFEYHLLVIALPAVVAVDGSGALSLDCRLTRPWAPLPAARATAEAPGRRASPHRVRPARSGAGNPDPGSRRYLLASPSRSTPSAP